MPSRAYNLDTGFDHNPLALTPPSTPEVAPRPGGLFDIGGNLAAMGQDIEVLAAGFRQESAVINGFQYLTQPKYVYDPTFNVESKLKETGLWDDHRWNFMNVESEQEFNDVAQKVAQEEKDKATLAASGFQGFVAMAMAGIIDPTILLPFVGPGVKGAKAFAVGAGYGLLGGALQEIPLQLNQETRTAQESVNSVAMSTVLGGVLGGAVGFLNRPMKEIADGMVGPQDGQAIPGYEGIVPGGSSGGAKFAGESAGALQPSYASVTFRLPDGSYKTVDPLDAIANISPVARQINQDELLVARDGMAQLSNAGLRQEGNVRGISGAPGGDVEELVKAWDALQYPSERKINDLFEQYVFGNTGRKVAPVIRSAIQAKRSGLLSRAEFKRRVSLQLFDEEVVDAIPEVVEAAQFIRKEFYDKVLEAATAPDVKLFETPDSVKGDKSYLNRDYLKSAITKDLPGFIRILKDNFKAKLDDDFAKQFAKYQQQQAKAKTQLDDLKRPIDEVERLRAEFVDKLKKLDESRTEDEINLEDFIADARSSARSTKLTPEEKAATRAAAAELEASGGPRLAARREERRALKTRINNLNRSRAMIEQRRLQKLDRIDGVEEEQLGSLNRVVRSAQKFLAKLEGASDESLDGLVSELKNKFAKAGDEFDRGEERISKVLGRQTTELETINPNKLVVKGGEYQLRHVYSTAEVPENFQFSDNFTGDRYDGDSGGVYGDGVYLASDPKWINGDLDRFRSSDLPKLDVTFKPKNALHLTPETANEIAKKAGTTNPAELAKWAEANGYDSLIVDGWDDFIEELNQKYPMGEEALAFIPIPKHLQKLVSELDPADFGMMSRQALDRGEISTQRAKELEVKLRGLDSDGAQDQVVVFDTTSIKVNGPAKGDFSRVGFESKSPVTLDNELLGLDLRQQDRAGRLSDIAEELERVESTDREALRGLIQEGLDESLSKVNALNSRRAVRAAKLEKEVETLDPKLIDAKVEKLTEKLRGRTEEFIEKARLGGSDATDLEKGSASFDRYAEESADTVAHKILGSNLRLPGIDILFGERGSELERVLNIDSKELIDFLETDISKLMRAHLRTFGPDIEIAKKFGEPDARQLFQRLTEEYTAKAKLLKKEMTAAGKTPEQIGKRLEKLGANFDQSKRDLIGTIQRVRHQYGIPANPAGVGTRMGHLMLNVNTLRFMGNVTISSVLDVAAPVQKYGLLSVMRDAYLPLISNLKLVKMNAREAQLAGTMVDLLTHARSLELKGVFTDVVRGTKAEKLVEYAASRMGMVALFDYWTTAMKQVTSLVANGKISRSITYLMEDTGSAGARKEATAFLAQNGIDGTMAQRIYEQMQLPGGGEKVNGVWYPNTEAWTDADAVRAYRASLAGEVDDTIVTPGLERPLVTNVNLPARMLFQFKSFGLSATTKIMMAGMQNNGAGRAADMAIGSMLSLALGTLSYYLWATSVGGQTQQEMLNATPEKWATEAFLRSGLIGVFGDGLKMAQSILGLQDSNSQYYSDDIGEAFGGPSYALAESLRQAAVEPKRRVHQLRLVAPLQNHFLLRRFYDQMEAAFGAPRP